MLLIRELMYCKPGKVKPLSEFEVESLDAFEKMMSGQGQQMDPDAMKQMEEMMKGYHELVEFGRREIYKIEN